MIKLDGANKRQMIRLHRELWDWLYHNPDKEKEAWPRWDRNGGDISWIMTECFACYYVEKARLFCFNDDGCPLFIWPKSENNHCLNDNSEYGRWQDAQTSKTRKKYAAMIRDLPVNRRRRK